MSGMNLEHLVDTPEAEVELRHPATGAPTGAFVTLAGPEHPVRRQMVFALARRMRAQLQATGTVEVSDPEADAIDEDDRLGRCILGWRGLWLEYSPAAARQLMADPARRWLRAQVKQALDKRELFIGGSAPA